MATVNAFYNRTRMLLSSTTYQMTRNQSIFCRHMHQMQAQSYAPYTSSWLYAMYGVIGITPMILCNYDDMKKSYHCRKTVKAFYKGSKNTPIFDSSDLIVDRDEERQQIEQDMRSCRIQNSLESPATSKGIIFHGAEGAGRSTLVSQAFKNVNEPFVRVDLAPRFDRYYACHETTQQIAKSLAKSINLYDLAHGIDGNYTLSELRVHLHECNAWLNRVRNYPWYVYVTHRLIQSIHLILLQILLERCS